MSTNRLLQHLRDFIRRQGGSSGVTDGQLLERFLKERDDTAFEVLVWRHGPMVLALGRRVLGNAHDAEDVLQATFLTLVRKGGAIGKSASLSSWLYKVAYRIALRLQARTAKTLVDGRLVEDVPAPETDESVWRELRPLLDAAIERLPEKYRTAIVLCDLQGKTYREAAEQLGCTASAISTRVTRARQLLRKRLAHHGLSVTLGVLSAALAQRTAAALPAPLTAATVRAAASLLRAESTTVVISASVAELVEGASQTMSITRFQVVMCLALAAGTVAVGAGILAHREPLTAPADPPPAATKAPAAAVTVRGRVLDPDGKPVKGARLYWPRIPKTMPRSEEELEKIEVPQRGQADAEGRFRFELPQADIKPEWRLVLIAAADSYGVTWTDWPTIAAGGELTLRLVKDQPIEGRILNTEGKPQAGVRVSINTLGTIKEGKVDAFVTAWKREWQMAIHHSTERMFQPLNQILPAATTDKDGRFRITGAGADRLVVLRVRGRGIAQEALYVVSRAGFDAAPVNKAVLDRTPSELRHPGQPQLLYGPKLTYVVPANRSIEGTVREAGTGKPVAGYMVNIIVGYGAIISAVTDKEGRYKLAGVPKQKQYLVGAEPPAGSSWLRAGARIDDTGGVQSLKVDFTVTRGVLLKGRIIDKTTGKGVRGDLRFAPLPGNTFANKPGYDSYKYERMGNPTEADGRFKLAVIPGPGVLTFQADAKEKANGSQQVNPYTQAEFDAREREHIKIANNEDDSSYFTSIDNSREYLKFFNAVKMLDLAPDAGTATCDLFVQRGRTITVKIEDSDGKPLAGATVAGVTALGWDVFPLKDAACTVFALDPKKPRRILFFHAQRKRAGSLTVRGDEKESLVAHLGSTGSVIGRLLDRDDQPLAGASIDLSSPDRSASELYRRLRQRQPMIRTDKDGRFRIDGIVPEVKFTVGITLGRTFFVGEPRIGARQVKSGETFNLGDVRVKPGP